MKIRSFAENPLLEKVRYVLGKALSDKDIYIKIGDDSYELVENKTFATVFLKYKIRRDDSYRSLFIREEDVYMSIEDIAAEITRQESAKEKVEFIINEVIAYLKYKETIMSLMKFYKGIRERTDFVLNEDDILKK